MNCVFAYTNQSDTPKTYWYATFWNSLIKWDLLKVWSLVWFLVCMVALYTITVNISSTEWYYYAQALKLEEKAKFQHNITKLDVMTMQSNLRNNLSFTSLNRYNSVDEITIVE